MPRNRVIQKANIARTPTIPLTQMGATCVAEYEALVAGLCKTVRLRGGLVIATVCEVDTTGGATTVGLGRVGTVGGVGMVGGVGTVREVVVHSPAKDINRRYDPRL